VISIVFMDAFITLLVGFSLLIYIKTTVHCNIQKHENKLIAGKKFFNL